MTSIQNCIKTLERLSLVTCSRDVLPLLERTLKNVEPILRVDTKGVAPLLWQNELSADRLHNDEPNIRLDTKDLRRNASGFCEDYIGIGLLPKRK